MRPPRARRAGPRRSRRRVERRAPRGPRRPRRSRSGCRRRARSSGNGELRARECRSVVPQQTCTLPDRREDRMNQQQHEDRRRLRRVPGGHRGSSPTTTRTRRWSRSSGPARSSPRRGRCGRRSRARTSGRAGSRRRSEEFQAAVDIDPVNDYAHYGARRCAGSGPGDRTGARGHLRLATVMRPDNADYRPRSPSAADVDARAPTPR